MSFAPLCLDLPLEAPATARTAFRPQPVKVAPARDSLIGPTTSASYNVVAGWFSDASRLFDIPPMPKQRNKTRAGYRKTGRRRGDVVIGPAKPHLAMPSQTAA